MRKDFIVMIVLALTLVVSGCASLDGEPEDVDSPQNESPDNSEEASEDDEEDVASEEDEDDDDIREIVIEGGNFYFDSESIEVEQGETVRFVFENVDGTHDLRIPELQEGTSVISGGESETFQATFEEEGELEFICSVGNHAEQGMTGTIEVV